MNRQQYRKSIREIDKQLAEWKKYAERLTWARNHAPTEKLGINAATSLMVLSQQVYKLLLKRKNIVLSYGSTNRTTARPSDAKANTHSCLLDEQPS